MSSPRHEVLVLGGGAAGLAAMAELERSGVDAALVEARDRLGGRIWTRHSPSTREPLELGAEFVHGNAPETTRLAEAASLELVDVETRQFWARAGRIESAPDLERAMHEAMQKTARVAKEGGDCSFAEALAAARVSEPGRSIALLYVSSFEAADPGRISARALAAGDLGADRTRRFLHGYDGLVGALCHEMDLSHVHLGFIARAVRWRRERVTVTASPANAASSVREFRGVRAIVALPLGMLSSDRRFVENFAPLFEPTLDAKENAIRALALGHALRVVLAFREPFWRDSPMRQPGSFLHIDGAAFPVVWTGSRPDAHLLTAWAGGNSAEALEGLDSGELVDRALSAIERAFVRDRTEIERGLVDSAVHRWSRDPFARSAYSYPLVGGESAGESLAAPIADTLFFAGEAASSPPANGTVEGALASGRRAAREVLRSMGRLADTH